MAGRPRIVRNKQSYINQIDAHTFSGPMKMGTSPSIGVTRNYWYNYQTQCNQDPNAVKKSYNNMVFLNINCAQTPVPSGFTPSNPSKEYNNYASGTFGSSALLPRHSIRAVNNGIFIPRPSTIYYRQQALVVRGGTIVPIGGTGAIGGNGGVGPN